MRTRLALSSAMILALAAPAAAQDNAGALAYFETSTARSLAANRWQANYALDTGARAGDTIGNGLALALGLTDELMAAAAMNLGGDAARALGVEGYAFALAYAPPVAALGLRTALQVQYRSGPTSAADGRLVLSYDRPAEPLLGEASDQFDASLNLGAGGDPFAGVWRPAYALGLSYPLIGPVPEGAHTLIRRQLHLTDSRLRLTFEAKGGGADGGHYVVPGAFFSPTAGMRLGLGLGVKIAGEGPTSYGQAQFEVQF
jgi:hypothetical protein